MILPRFAGAWLLGAWLVVGCGRSPGGPEPPLAAGVLEGMVSGAAVLSPRQVAREANAFAAVRIAARALPPGQNEKWAGLGAAPHVEDARASEALRELDACEEALDGAAQAAKLPEWLVTEEVETTELNRVKVLLKALTARARARITLGQQLDGVEDLLAARRIADGLMAARPGARQALQAFGAVTIVDRAVQRASADPNLGVPAAKALLAGFQAAPERDVAMEDILRTELTRVLLAQIATLPDPAHDHRALVDFGVDLTGDAIFDLIRQHPKPFDRRATAASAIAAFGRVIESLDSSAKVMSQARAIAKELTTGWPAGMLSEGVISAKDAEASRPGFLKVSNPVGRLIVATQVASLMTLTDCSYKWRTHREANRAILAIRIWKMGHEGAMPPSLDQVVEAGLLSKPPRDFYGSGALRYDRSRALIWSVGADGVDSGGMNPPDRQIGADVVWPALGIS